MPVKKSNPEKRSTQKKKPTARAAATDRVASRRGTPPAAARVPTSQKQRSHGRFPGETPLTGEDRPADRAGGKKRGQGTGRPSRTASR